MKGQMIVYRPVDPPERLIYEYTTPIPLEDLQKVVGGYIEVVPHFDTIELAGKLQWLRGRRLRLPSSSQKTTQRYADRLWSEALITAGKADSPAPDFLVGPIAVVTGDDEFLDEL